ncbi:hypothetical protein L6452_09369 [Arctium lappa]|uniref:Uncharacterized protein n=1 Tax=Arctium lappa TaxID=4217 RepID=A0ACB9DK59_ARCLA|nr:hypothetical protein L6452_09369 [Arctium lappa]
MIIQAMQSHLVSEPTAPPQAMQVEQQISSGLEGSRLEGNADGSGDKGKGLDNGMLQRKGEGGGNRGATHTAPTFTTPVREKAPTITSVAQSIRVASKPLRGILKMRNCYSSIAGSEGNRSLDVNVEQEGAMET